MFKLFALILLINTGISVAAPANDSTIGSGQDGKTLLDNISPKQMGSSGSSGGAGWQGYHQLNGKAVSLSINLNGKQFSLHADGDINKTWPTLHDLISCHDNTNFKCSSTYSCDARARIVNNEPQVYLCSRVLNGNSTGLFDNGSQCAWRSGEQLSNRVCTVTVSPSGVGLTFGSQTKSIPWN